VIEGKWVEEENLHLTWVFLGELPEADTTVRRMEPLAPLPCPVEIRGLGTFGKPPRIFYAQSREKLLYQQAGKFRKAGFDLYRFTPHITLCRIKKIHNYKRFKEVKKEYEDKILGEIVPEITLYKSVLTKERAYYKKIESVTR